MTENVKVPKTLQLINEISVPKSQYNSFGKYNFRNNEDIQTALKPMLVKFGLIEKVSSTVEDIAGQVVVGVHVLIQDPENPTDIISGDGYAIVDVNKKGMDAGQATGASQSYASKYAYGQALMLDDIKDNDDSSNSPKASNTKPQAKPRAVKPIYPKSEVDKLVAQKKMTKERANALYKNGQIDMDK